MKTKFCPRCQQEKPGVEFNKNTHRKDGLSDYCRKCKRAYDRLWKLNQSLQQKEQTKRCDRKRQRSYRRRAKKIVLDYYGRKCACCGVVDEVFLVLDHVNNDGAKHRAEIGDSGSRTYAWLAARLKEEDRPLEGFQILCHNCNAAKALVGTCPHKRQSQ